jgi:tellurite resistance protein
MLSDSLASLSEIFQPGFDARELGPLAALLRARPYLGALITLFRGGEEEVLLRLLLLREIGARAEAPRWSPQELDAHFAYVQPAKLNTVLLRFRKEGLLNWESDTGLYSLSETGRVALAAIATLLQFADGEAELGYLTAQVAAGQALGQVSAESLQHLLARLTELHADFEVALESQSEHQIGVARAKLDSVWRWVEKGTEVIREVLKDDANDRYVLQVAQAIASAQGRMLQMTGVFQRRSAELAAQRVHLGQSGLTSAHVADWLRGQSQEQLAELGRDLLEFHPDPLFAVSDILLDVAEHELLEREHVAEEAAALPASALATAVSELEAERFLLAEALHAQLRDLRTEAPLHAAVLADDYPETAYRLSLLSLLGDAEAALPGSVLADLVRLPLVFEVEAEVDALDHPEVAALSRGRLRPK